MSCFRHHGAGVCEVWFAGHLPEEEQELHKPPVEAGGGEAAGLGHELPGRDTSVVTWYQVIHSIDGYKCVCLLNLNLVH